MKKHLQLQVNVKEEKMSKSTEKALFVCNGAVGHALEERAENDYYSSSPEAAVWLMKIEPQINKIWENAVGGWTPCRRI